MSIFDHLRENERLALFLDYDGTMVPLKGWEPHTSKPDREILHIVRELVKLSNVQFTIVTGRNFSDIREYFPVKGIFLAACHGGIIRDRSNKIYYLVPPKSIRQSVVMAEKFIKSLIYRQRGFILEDKLVGFAVHYRNAYPQTVERVKERFGEFYESTLSKSELDLYDWRASIELKHRAVSKGKGVKYILDNFTPSYYFPIFVGDDISDRDVYEYISDRGAFYFVGENIRDVQEVREFLKKVIDRFRGTHKSELSEE